MCKQVFLCYETVMFKFRSPFISGKNGTESDTDACPRSSGSWHPRGVTSASCSLLQVAP